MACNSFHTIVNYFTFASPTEINFACGGTAYYQIKRNTPASTSNAKRFSLRGFRFTAEHQTSGIPCPPSLSRTQRISLPPETSSSGTPAEHSGTAETQRGAKGQPFSSERPSPDEPGIEESRPEE